MSLGVEGECMNALAFRGMDPILKKENIKRFFCFVVYIVAQQL